MADAIAKSGAKTAWDAVRFTVPNVQLREVRGEPARIQRRGRASLYQDDQVRVILDHVPITDLRVLRQVAATDILTIEILTGLDATTLYGPIRRRFDVRRHRDHDDHGRTSLTHRGGAPQAAPVSSLVARRPLTDCGRCTRGSSGCSAPPLESTSGSRLRSFHP